MSYDIAFVLFDMVSNKLSLPIILDPRACWEWFVCEIYFSYRYCATSITYVPSLVLSTICLKNKQWRNSHKFIYFVCLHSLPKLHVLHGESIPVTIIHFYSIQHYYSVPHAQLKSCWMKPVCRSLKWLWYVCQLRQASTAQWNSMVKYHLNHLF